MLFGFIDEDAFVKDICNSYVIETVPMDNLKSRISGIE